MQNITIHFIFYFSLSEFIDAVLLTFFWAAFVTFIDILSATFSISSHTITESSAILFKYLLHLQIHVLGFQL